MLSENFYLEFQINGIVFSENLKKNRDVLIKKVVVQNLMKYSKKISLNEITKSTAEINFQVMILTISIYFKQ
jgi:hypothetical protein